MDTVKGALSALNTESETGEPEKCGYFISDEFEKQRRPSLERT